MGKMLGGLEVMVAIAVVFCLYLVFGGIFALQGFGNERFASERELYAIPTGWKDICQDGFKETIVPSGAPEVSPLSPDAANASYLALPLRPMGTQESLNNWGTVTSQRCLTLDQSEPVKNVNKKTNLLQRTNNYPPQHPDTCAAPFHEFLSTFYKPAGAIAATPLAGTNFPPSTQCA